MITGILVFLGYSYTIGMILLFGCNKPKSNGGSGN
jgi:hypothetical protein